MLNQVQHDGNMSQAKTIDGKSIAEEIRQEVADQVAKLNIKPSLAVILVGSDPASHLYVSIKKKAAQEAGIEICLYTFDEDAKQDEILETIEFLNEDKEIDAILVQLPLPEHLDEDKIIQAIDPKKDVDGFGPNTKNIVPPLNMGIMQLITSTQEDTENKSAVILARSKEFTKSLSSMLNDFSIQAKSINPDDSDSKSATKDADIVISAMGKPESIKADDIKDNAILIDVGTTRIKNKTIGDFNFESFSKKASHITPVPGGVGPMTVAMLLKNTISLARTNKE